MLYIKVIREPIYNMTNSTNDRINRNNTKDP